jgi:hypothetical protein
MDWTVLGFVVAAGIWWIYFDIAAPSSARELQDVGEEEDAESSSHAGDADSHVSDVRHDLFVWSSAADLRHCAGWGWSGGAGCAPGQGCSFGRRLGARRGLALFLAGVAVVISGTTQKVRSIWPWPVAAIPIVQLGALVPFPASLLLTATYAVGILLLAAQGTPASRRPDTALAGAD